MCRLAVLLLLAAACAGCGGVGKKTDVTHHQPQIVARTSGKAAEREGAAACRRLPHGTLPRKAKRAAKVAALRAYLQTNHPTDDVHDMLRGCLRVVHLH